MQIARKPPDGPATMTAINATVIVKFNPGLVTLTIVDHEGEHELRVPVNHSWQTTLNGQVIEPW